MLQGARHVHISALHEASYNSKIDVDIIELRTSADLESSKIDGLIMPGGESTTMRLMGNSDISGLMPPLLKFIRENPKMPVMGTCAGAIIMADPQDGKSPLVDASISRNAYGRQTNSFEAMIYSSLLKRSFPGIFIRAPKFQSIGNDTYAIANYDEQIVGVKKTNRIALSFHPELSQDTGFHQWILEQAKTYAGVTK